MYTDGRQNIKTSTEQRAARQNMKLTAQDVSERSNVCQNTQTDSTTQYSAIFRNSRQRTINDRQTAGE
jgi:molecular chaperone GrpE (heat shock protein)